LRGKGRKLLDEDNWFDEDDVKDIPLVSVPLRGKGRKLHFEELSQLEISKFPSPCGEKVENYGMVDSTYTLP